MILKDKVAVIYGAGGAIGGSVARTFASEGAKVFLTGRRLAPLELVRKDIVDKGGFADLAEVDALDEQAIDLHLQSVMEKAGRVDISFNSVGLPNSDTVGIPMVDLDVEKFVEPIAAYTRSYFLTARLAARRMIPNRSGVIMAISALPARVAAPLIGGHTAALAGKDSITRSLSLELAPLGLRVLGIRPHALPESESIKRIYKLKASQTMSWEQWQEALASRTHTRRLSTLAEVGRTAAFLASDGASGMTGTTVNLTMGNLDD